MNKAANKGDRYQTNLLLLNEYRKTANLIIG